MIIGIDNGLDGGIVALSPCAGCAPVAMVPMPTTTRSGEREVDAFELLLWMLGKGAKANSETVIAIEEPLPHAMSSAAARSMAFSFGRITGAIEWRLRYATIIRVKCGNAIDGWQRAMLGRFPKGKSKEYALAAAQSIWPGETWLATPRSKVPHSGLVDAALIAEFIRRKHHSPR